MTIFHLSVKYQQYIHSNQKKESHLIVQLFCNWWLYTVGGVLAIVFGILALIKPGQTTNLLVLLFGAFALVYGIFNVASGITFHRYFKRW
jgi:uncharacterized membrane protein HdeD (DUF308 family)